MTSAAWVVRDAPQRGIKQRRPTSWPRGYITLAALGGPQCSRVSHQITSVPQVTRVQGGEVSWVLVHDSLPSPAPLRALRAHLVAKGQQPRPYIWCWRPKNSFLHSPCPFCPLCTPTLSLNRTLTLTPTPALGLLLTLPPNLSLDPNPNPNRDPTPNPNPNLDPSRSSHRRLGLE